MSEKNTFPVLSNEGSLSHYLQQIKKFPMLTEKQEVSLANKWIKEGDTKAAHTLVTCLLYTSPSPRDPIGSRMPSSA